MRLASLCLVLIFSIGSVAGEAVNYRDEVRRLIVVPCVDTLVSRLALLDSRLDDKHRSIYVALRDRSDIGLLGIEVLVDGFVEKFRQVDIDNIYLVFRSSCVLEGMDLFLSPDNVFVAMRDTYWPTTFFRLFE